VQVRGWTERLLSASVSRKGASASSSRRRDAGGLITPAVSYHSTVTYRDLLTDPLSRRYSLPTSSTVPGPPGGLHHGPGSALQRKVRFAEPPESSVIEIESRRRGAEHAGRAARPRAAAAAAAAADSAARDDWLSTAEYSSASSLTEKLDRLELENALASAAMKRSRPFLHHEQLPHLHYQTYQPPQHNIGKIRYDTRCCFNVRSKADMSQLNLPHGTDN